MVGDTIGLVFARFPRGSLGRGFIGLGQDQSGLKRLAVDTTIPAAPSRTNLLWLVAILLLAVVISVFWPIETFPQSRQIVFRYAEQFRAGHGLVFNPGERVLLVASPAYMLLLGVSGVILPSAAIELVARLWSGVALAVGAYSLFRIAQRIGLSELASGIAALLYVIAWPFLRGLGTAFPVAAGLSLLALNWALSSRWRLAGFTFAVAVLCSPEAILLALLLLFFASQEKNALRYGQALFFSLVVAVVSLYLYYGVQLWDGILLLKPDLVVAFWPKIIPLAVLAIWGWYKQRANPVVSLLAAWILLDSLVLIVLQGVPQDWQYALVIGPLILLAVIGGQNLKTNPLFAYIFLLIVFVFPLRGGISTIAVNSTCPGCYTWSPNYFGVTPADVQSYKSIAIPSTESALILQSSPNQVFVAMDGQLQPDIKRMIERGDVPSVLIRYAPEILIRTSDKLLSTGSLARLDYRPIGETGNFKRNTPIGTFVNQPSNIAFGPDMRLIGLALDQPSLRPGQLLRVRLDWELARPADRPVTVDLQLTANNKTLAQARDEFMPSVFQAGRWSTYHTITLADNAQPGSLALNVAVIVNDGTIARVPVVTLTAVPR